MSLQEIQDALAYDPETGLFTWRHNSKGHGAGDRAGGKNHYGYIQISIHLSHRRRTMQAHRLAWLLVHKIEPDGHVDHINRVRDDNRITNLRVVSQRVNVLNSARFDAKAIGATFHKSGKWQAQVHLSGRSIYLGLFPTQDQACEAYRAAVANAEGGS